jgi:aspartyl-tRNA synthetase
MQLRDSYINISRYIRSRYHHKPPTVAIKSQLRYYSADQSIEFEKRADIEEDPRDVLSPYDFEKRVNVEKVSEDLLSPNDRILYGFAADCRFARSSDSKWWKVAELPVDAGSLYNTPTAVTDESATGTENETGTDDEVNEAGLRRISSRAGLVDLPGDEAGTTKGIIPLHGFITTKRSATSKLTFCTLVDPHLRLAVQLKFDLSAKSETNEADNDHQSGRLDGSFDGQHSTHAILEKLGPHTPVQVRGRLVARQSKETGVVDYTDKHVGTVRLRADRELEVTSINVLNSTPSITNAQHGRNFPMEQRHLQLRTNSKLRDNLRYRSLAMATISKCLFMNRFDQIETPILFKSTSEGAREFIVPTRKKGFAYALPQSPQQYKQLLMASGIHRYFQFAKCFRDEDLRTDRQPEFTQVDLEMSFAQPIDVMIIIESMMEDFLLPAFGYRQRPEKHAYRAHFHKPRSGIYPKLTYQKAMAFYGSDKPALQWPGRLHRVDSWLPSNLVGMLTSLPNPVVEAFMVRPKDADPSISRSFINDFMSSPAGQPYTTNPDGMPGIAIFDPSKPTSGFAAFGHQAAEQVEAKFSLQPGDIVIIQPRPFAEFTGGSTPIGNLRVDVFKAAHAAGLLNPIPGLHPLWVRDFPLFTPLTDVDIASGSPSHTKSTSGLVSTHHPFTAPVPVDWNLSRLKSDPSSVIGDHFDLVINGVEVGGGSRRIHSAALQDHILRDILKLPDERVEEFRHLLDALKDGCPPHTGFALGFDRLVSMLRGTETVRDVIAFPKTGDGEDRFVGSPAPITEAQLREYHLDLVGEKETGEQREVVGEKEGDGRVSIKA